MTTAPDTPKRADALPAHRPAPRTFDRPHSLTIPEISDDDDCLTAGMKYAAVGWYVGPLAAGTKHPGSVLGTSWHTKTSRDPDLIAAWFAGTDHGIFLHVGRSGAVVFDVDHPELIPPALAAAIEKCHPPFQSTRADEPGRGHYVFAVPEGRTFGNGTGSLGGAWGEVRGANGVIVAQPTQHPDGGRYKWQR